MDVRAKQLLSYHVVLFPLACVYPVSPHVISNVGRFSVNLKRLDKLTVKEYPVFVMNTVKAYEEVVDFIAAGTTPQDVVAFRPSRVAQGRVEDLLSREKDGSLSPAEKSELDHYLQLEHLMRLAKARARDFLPNE